MRMVPIRKPDSTKNSSTPYQPPKVNDIQSSGTLSVWRKWLINTIMIAAARTTSSPIMRLLEKSDIHIAL